MGYLKCCTLRVGKGAEKAANRKKNKCKSLVGQNYHFIPFAPETMGPWCTEEISFIDKLGHMISSESYVPCSKFFLEQRIGMAIQRGDAFSIMGSIFGSNSTADTPDFI